MYAGEVYCAELPPVFSPCQYLYLYLPFLFPLLKLEQFLQQFIGICSSFGFMIVIILAFSMNTTAATVIYSPRLGFELCPCVSLCVWRTAVHLDKDVT